MALVNANDSKRRRVLTGKDKLVSMIQQVWLSIRAMGKAISQGVRQ